MIECGFPQELMSYAFFCESHGVDKATPIHNKF